MRLTAQELEQMKNVDIGAVSADALADVSGMAFDRTLPREERLARFVRRAVNPYCFSVGGVGVKIEFAEGGPLPPGDAGGLSYPAKERAVTAVAACSHFETKCPEASTSLLIAPGRVII